jgi:alpha-galactosidase
MVREASRNLHDWARKYRVQMKVRRTSLLNNWEFFDFDENKIADLFKGLDIGVDMFFCWMTVGLEIKSENDDKAGLEIGKENAKKLPHGLGYLVKEAKKEGIKFGIWIEPEMVNP